MSCWVFGCSRAAVVSIHKKVVGYGRTCYKRCRLFQYHYSSAIPLHSFYFPFSRNGIFQQDNTPCHKARIVLQWFKKHADESQLMSWLPNSQDLNHPEHVWHGMDWQLRAQKQLSQNIEELHDCCFNIWYNLSPAIFQELVALMSRKVAIVLHGERGST